MWAQSGELVGTVPRKRALIHTHAGDINEQTRSGGGRGVRVLWCCYQLECTTADCTASKLAFTSHSVTEAP